MSRRLKTRPQLFDEKFVVNADTGCWEWTAYTVGGYGRFLWSGGQLAHRFSYERFVGPIPEGLTLDHLCRNRSCVNPAHLEPVTALENTRRGGNNLKTHCPEGHEYDVLKINARGWRNRRCSICDRAYFAERYRRNPEKWKRAS